MRPVWRTSGHQEEARVSTVTTCRKLPLCVRLVIRRSTKVLVVEDCPPSKMAHPDNTDDDDDDNGDAYYTYKYSIV
eukprot:scaffold142649_cov25-Tisochrysis_lutea.AAC.1